MVFYNFIVSTQLIQIKGEHSILNLTLKKLIQQV